MTFLPQPPQVPSPNIFHLGLTPHVLHLCCHDVGRVLILATEEYICWETPSPPPTSLPSTDFVLFLSLRTAIADTKCSLLSIIFNKICLVCCEKMHVYYGLIFQVV